MLGNSGSSLSNCRMKVYLLLLVLVLQSNVSAEVLAAIDWSKAPNKVPGGWSGSQTAGADRIKPMVDHHVPHKGSNSTVLRVEVRAGDNVQSQHGERAEVVGMQNTKGKALPVNGNSGHEFYALSVKLDPSWKAPDANDLGYTWGTFFQLHGPDSLGASPSLAIMAQTDFHLDVCGGDLSDGGKRKNPRGATSLPFSNSSLNLGQWVSFIIDVIWSDDNKGAVAVYRRDDGKADWVKVLDQHNIATLQHSNKAPVGDHYWKAGFYRSASKHPNVLWLGSIARGTNRDEVATAAFGKR
jgi:hypothetical protein